MTYPTKGDCGGGGCGFVGIGAVVVVAVCANAIVDLSNILSFGG